MNVYINGQSVTTEASMISELITERGIDERGLAVAIGDRVVSRKLWSQTPIFEGLCITLIRATQGG